MKKLLAATLPIIILTCLWISGPVQLTPAQAATEYLENTSGRGPMIPAPPMPGNVSLRTLLVYEPTNPPPQIPPPPPVWADSNGTHYPQISSLASLRITNAPTPRVIATFNSAIYGFGVAYSDNLSDWVTVGEAHWTNATPDNPFTAIHQITQCRITVGDPQWTLVSRPSGPTYWEIHLEDPTIQPGGPKRFYMVYPLDAVTGLP